MLSKSKHSKSTRVTKNIIELDKQIGTLCSMPYRNQTNSTKRRIAIKGLIGNVLKNRNITEILLVLTHMQGESLENGIDDPYADDNVDILQWANSEFEKEKNNNAQHNDTIIDGLISSVLSNALRNFSSKIDDSAYIDPKESKVINFDHYQDEEIEHDYMKRGSYYDSD